MNSLTFNDMPMHTMLLACHTKFNRLYMNELKLRYPELNLLPGQPKILEFLKNNRAYQREIADGCLLEPSTLSLILVKMEKSGLITRTKTHHNRKNNIVTLTEKGNKIADIVIQVMHELEIKVQEHCTVPEKANVLVALRKICEQETYLLNNQEYETEPDDIA